MGPVRIEVRMTDRPDWALIGETGISGELDAIDASTFDDVDAADAFMTSHQENPEFAEWWERLEEWRCVDILAARA